MNFGLSLDRTNAMQSSDGLPQIFDLQQFLSTFPLEEVKKDAFIYKPESSSDLVYFIEKGSVILGSYHSNGEEVISAILFKSQVFGEQGLTGSRTRDEFAQAKEKTAVRIVPLSHLRKAMLDNGALGISVNQLILKKLLVSQNKWKSQITDYARTRVIDFIIHLVENNGRRVGFEWSIDQFFPHREVASIIGSSRQTVTVTLNELRNKNVIYFDRKRLIVRDLEQLKKEKF